MKYEVWNLVQLSDGEEPIPLFKYHESDLLNECVEYMEIEQNKKIPLALIVDGKIISNNYTYIFEREGDNIYKKHTFSKTREKIS